MRYNQGLTRYNQGHYTAGLQPIDSANNPFDKPAAASAYIELAQAGLMYVDSGHLKPSYFKVKDSYELLCYQEVIAKWIPLSAAQDICQWMGGGPETAASDAAMNQLGDKCPYLYNLVLSKAWDKQSAEEQSVSRNGMQDLRKALDTVAQPVKWVADQGISLAQATGKGVGDTLGVLNTLLSHLPLVLGGVAALYVLSLWMARPRRP